MIDRILTIAEQTVERAIEALGDIPFWIDAAELRVDRIRGPLPDLAVFRDATRKDLIFTRRSEDGTARFNEAEAQAALDAGFERVDVEFGPQIDPAFVARNRERVILSHHDYSGIPDDLEALITKMRRTNAAFVKIAVTPRSFDENLPLLRIQRANAERNDLALFGMGTAGLYSRILAPFAGARLLFVAPENGPAAAPGQLTVETAAMIYGSSRRLRPADAFFAVVGNPAAHSLSPVLHNRLFRENRVSAAYGIAEVSRLEDVAEALVRGAEAAPLGISITAPFKEIGFRFAVERGARMAQNAREAGAINTLVRMPDGLLADNTDVDGFEMALAHTAAGSGPVAVVGAGGTARAALVAIRRAGLRAVLFNRTASRATALSAEFGAEVRPLEALGEFEGELTINTIPASSDFALPDSAFDRNRTLVDVNYGDAAQATLTRAMSVPMRYINGTVFLDSQAERQNALFIDAIEAFERVRS